MEITYDSGEYILYHKEQFPHIVEYIYIKKDLLYSANFSFDFQTVTLVDIIH